MLRKGVDPAPEPLGYIEVQVAWYPDPDSEDECEVLTPRRNVENATQ